MIETCVDFSARFIAFLPPKLVVLKVQESVTPPSSTFTHAMATARPAVLYSLVLVEEQHEDDYDDISNCDNNHNDEYSDKDDQPYGWGEEEEED